MPDKTDGRKRKLTASEVVAVLRLCLERGKSVEIEGLGTFDKTREGEFCFLPRCEPSVFLAYVEEDSVSAARIYQLLQEAGCKPWMDKANLVPGQNWPRAIERAIEMCDYFVPLFSTKAVSKRSQFQAELRFALDCAQDRPLDTTFVIPVRLEGCQIPQRITESIQCVDLFPDWDAGFRKLLGSIRPSIPPSPR